AYWIDDTRVVRDASVMVLTLFFFSSRRRHTRFSRDWSSDVCSSDLPELAAMSGPGFKDLTRLASGEPEMSHDIFLTNRENVLHRSEERRVGKECRSWWGPCQEKAEGGIVTAGRSCERNTAGEATRAK